MSWPQQYRPAIALIGWALAAPGCIEEIAVGEAVARLNLSTCYGEGTSCQDSEVEPRTLELPELASCPLANAPPWRIAWSSRLEGEIEDESELPSATAIGPDGTLWLVSSDKDSMLELRRFDGSGEIHAPVAIDFWDAQQDAAPYRDSNIKSVSLAIDAQARAFIGIGYLDPHSEQVWGSPLRHVILVVDEQGAMTADPLPIEGVSGGMRLAIGADGQLIVGANSVDGRAALGRLTADPSVVWVQTGLRHASLHQLVGDAEGRTLVFGRTATDEPFAFEETVALYDERGNLVWDVRPGTALGMVIAQARDLVVLGTVPVAQPLEEMVADPVYGDLLAFKLDADQELLWSLRVEGESQFRAAVSDDDGAVYLVSDTAVHRIDAEGACETQEVENGVLEVYATSLYRAPNGTIYFWNPWFIVGAFSR